MRSIVGLLLPVAVGITIASCTTDACGCEPTPATARVYGQVTSASGNPVPDARVNGYSAPADGCYVDGLSYLDLGSVATGSDGTFVLGLAQGGALDSVCLFVFAVPPLDSTGLVRSDTTHVVLDFRFGNPQDSIRVDPVLRAR
jgi:hypothetical protein